MPSLTIEEIAIFSPFKTDNFVETGTCMGDTINNVKSSFETVCSIEISHIYYKLAQERFKNDSNVVILNGDSSLVLENVCKIITKPTFFWLDGHWSGGNTGRGAKDCPLLEELIQINKHCKTKCIVAIDDVRLFGKNMNEDWSDITKEKLINSVHSRLASCTYFSSELHSEDRMVLVLNEI